MMDQEKQQTESKYSRLIVSSLEPIPSGPEVQSISLFAQNCGSEAVALRVYLTDSKTHERKELETSVVLRTEQEIEVSFNPRTVFHNAPNQLLLGIQLSSEAFEYLPAKAVKLEATAKIAAPNSAPMSGALVMASRHSQTHQTIPVVLSEPSGFAGDIY